ncbi:unnamed protein product [Pedinophyceae sp. YPF-701]|nr:unnamed protein product [Pedinophyceae sp. YPF-701]
MTMHIHEAKNTHVANNENPLQPPSLGAAEKRAHRAAPSRAGSTRPVVRPGELSAVHRQREPLLQAQRSRCWTNDQCRGHHPGRRERRDVPEHAESAIGPFPPYTTLPTMLLLQPLSTRPQDYPPSKLTPPPPTPSLSPLVKRSEPPSAGFELVPQFLATTRVAASGSTPPHPPHLRPADGGPMSPPPARDDPRRRRSAGVPTSRTARPRNENVTVVSSTRGTSTRLRRPSPSVPFAADILLVKSQPRDATCRTRLFVPQQTPCARRQRPRRFAASALAAANVRVLRRIAESNTTLHCPPPARKDQPLRARQEGTALFDSPHLARALQRQIRPRTTSQILHRRHMPTLPVLAPSASFPRRGRAPPAPPNSSEHLHRSEYTALHETVCLDIDHECKRSVLSLPSRLHVTLHPAPALPSAPSTCPTGLIHVAYVTFLGADFHSGASLNSAFEEKQDLGGGVFDAGPDATRSPRRSDPRARIL